MANGYGYYPYLDNIRADTDTDIFIQKFADPNPYPDPIFGWRIRIRIWANPYPFYPFDTPIMNVIVPLSPSGDQSCFIFCYKSTTMRNLFSFLYIKIFNILGQHNQTPSNPMTTIMAAATTGSLFV